MPAEVRLPLETVYGFLLVLARVGGAFSFVPIPGFRNTPGVARIVLALGITMALLPTWPRIQTPDGSLVALAASLAAEAAFGITVGLAVALLNEAFVLASQIFGLQAGYGYASTIDPATQADSSVLQIFTHLSAALLFFALGMDRQVIHVFARSLEAHPAGAYVPSLSSAGPVLELGGVMFSTALRLALPVIALLMLVDVALALLGRINAQLQLLMLAFPAKMLVSMALLAALTAMLPSLYQGAAERTVRALYAVLRVGS